MSKITIVKNAAESAMTAENERTKQLSGRAEKLLAGIILVAGYQLSDVPTLLDSSSTWVKCSCYASLLVLGMAAFSGFSSLRVKGYAGYPRGDKLWESLKSDEVTAEAAEQAVVHLVLKTREQNARLNDAKAGWIFWCGWLLFAGILLVAASHLLDALANMAPA